MVKVYTLRHMFRGLPQGDTVPIMFTRDTEHRLSELEPKVLEDAVSRGWVTMKEVPTIGEAKKSVKDSAKPELAAEAQKKELAKGGKRS